MESEVWTFLLSLFLLLPALGLAQSGGGGGGGDDEDGDDAGESSLTTLYGTVCLILESAS